MTIEGLRALCAVVEAKSFRAAAERIHRTQPAVSQQIKALERELGHGLIERRTCRPTPPGASLYARARRILNDLDGLGREIRDFDETEARELRVGTSDTTALYVLPPVVRAFSKALPMARLALVHRASEAVAEQVARGELDLGIVTLPTQREDLEEHDLFEERLALVAPRSHPLGARRQLTLGDLHEEAFLLLHGDTRTGRVLQACFREAGFAPRVVLDSGSFEVIKRYVAQGVGVSFLPELVVTRSDRALVTVAVENLPRIRIGAVWRRGAYRTRAERVFVELIIKVARQRGYARDQGSA